MNEELQKRISAALDAGSERELASLIEQSPEAAAYARDLERLGGMLRDWPLPDPGDDAMEALALRIEQRLDEELPRIADPTLPPAFDDDDELRDATAGLLGGAGVSSGEYELIERVSMVPEGALAPSGLPSPAVVIRKPAAAPLPPPPPPSKEAKTEPPAVRAIPKLATAAEIQKQHHDPGRISFPSIPPAQPIASVTPITAKKERRPMGWVAGLAAAAAVGLGIVTTTSMYSSGALPSPSSLASSSEPTPADGAAEAVVAPAPTMPASPMAAPVAAGAVAEGARGTDQDPRLQGLRDTPYGVAAVREEGAPRGARSIRSPVAGGAPGELQRFDALAEEPAPEGLSEREVRSPARRARAAPAAPTPTTVPRTTTEPASGAAADVARAETRTAAPSAAAPSPAEPEMEGAAADLPALPERGEVLAALQRVEPAARACAADTHGTATVRIVVAPSGRVTTATVSGPFAGTPVGSCVARAVRTARFPRFSSDRFEITYPFTL